MGGGAAGTISENIWSGIKNAISDGMSRKLQYESKSKGVSNVVIN